MKTAVLQLTVPATYWEDYSERCPDDQVDQMATEIRRAGHRVTIEVNAVQLQYLQGDADFYAQGNTDDTPPAVLRGAKRVAQLCAAAWDGLQQAAAPAKAVEPGRLYISGHAPRRGYAIERCWPDAECSAAPSDSLERAMKPPKFFADRQHAERLVQRWNRRFALAPGSSDKS